MTGGVPQFQVTWEPGARTEGAGRARERPPAGSRPPLPPPSLSSGAGAWRRNTTKVCSFLFSVQIYLKCLKRKSSPASRGARRLTWVRRSPSTALPWTPPSPGRGPRSEGSIVLILRRNVFLVRMEILTLIVCWKGKNLEMAEGSRLLWSTFPTCWGVFFRSVTVNCPYNKLFLVKSSSL